MDYSACIHGKTRSYIRYLACVEAVVALVVVFAINPAVSVEIHRYNPSVEQRQWEENKTQHQVHTEGVPSTKDGGLSSPYRDDEPGRRQQPEGQIRRSPFSDKGKGSAQQISSQHPNSSSVSSRLSDTGASQNERTVSRVSRPFVAFQHRLKLQSVNPHDQHRIARQLKKTNPERTETIEGSGDLFAGDHLVSVGLHLPGAAEVQLASQHVRQAIPQELRRKHLKKGETPQKDGREDKTKSSRAHVHVSAQRGSREATQADTAVVVGKNDSHGDSAPGNTSVAYPSATTAPTAVSATTPVQTGTPRVLLTSPRLVHSGTNELSFSGARVRTRKTPASSLQLQHAARVVNDYTVALKPAAATGVPVEASTFTSLSARPSSKNTTLKLATRPAAAAEGTVTAATPSTKRPPIYSFLYPLPPRTAAHIRPEQQSPNAILSPSVNSLTEVREEAPVTLPGLPHTQLLRLRDAPVDAGSAIAASAADAATLSTPSTEKSPTALSLSATPPMANRPAAPLSSRSITDAVTTLKAAPTAIVTTPSVSGVPVSKPPYPPAPDPVTAPLTTFPLAASPIAVAGAEPPPSIPDAMVSAGASSTLPPDHAAETPVPLGTPDPTLAASSTVVPPAAPIVPAATVPLTAAVVSAARDPVFPVEPSAAVLTAAAASPAAAGPPAAVIVPGAGVVLAPPAPSAAAPSSSAAIPLAAAADPVAASAPAAYSVPASAIRRTPANFPEAAAPVVVAPLKPFGVRAPSEDPPPDYAPPSDLSPPADPAALPGLAYSVDGIPLPGAAPPFRFYGSEVADTAAVSATARNGVLAAGRPAAVSGDESRAPVDRNFDTSSKEESEQHKRGKACFDDCSCWPVWSIGIVTLVLNLTVSFVAFYRSASLFSRGLLSSQFYRGGGYWLIGVALLGLTTGTLIGALVQPACWAQALYLGGFLVTFFLSFVLLGRRGALLGCLGGGGAGGVIGVLAVPGFVGSVIGMVVGLLFGIVVGFAPICRGLKINERYVRASLGTDRRVSRRERYSEDLNKERRPSEFSPNLRERRTQSATSANEHASEYLFPTVEDLATHTTASTAAERVSAESAAHAGDDVPGPKLEVNESTASNEMNEPTAPASDT